MATPTTGKNGTIVVSALRARAHFGKLLRRVDDERRSLVIEKRGTPKAVLLSIRDYVKLAAPEPEVLRVIGEESERNGTSTLTSRQIDQITKTSRTAAPGGHLDACLNVGMEEQILASILPNPSISRAPRMCSSTPMHSWPNARRETRKRLA